MQHFTGEQMLQIDLANNFGLDKEEWLHRLLWAEWHHDCLEQFIDKAAESLLYRKAVLAYRKACKGFAIGHNMFMDGTASGLQVMAALSGCKKTAGHVNMINTGQREDVYTNVSRQMNALLPVDLVTARADVKKPLMTRFYNKLRQDTLHERQEIAFYEVLEGEFTGAEAVRNIINQCWNPMALSHSWTLPDGHVAKVLVTEVTTARIEVDELNHLTFAYRFESNQPSERGTALCARIIHSVDSYVARQMVLRAAQEGFQLAHIHDAFNCHPNHMGRALQLYREIMAEIADSDLLSDILSEITGSYIQVNKFSYDLSQDILASEYMLS